MPPAIIGVEKKLGVLLGVCDAKTDARLVEFTDHWVIHRVITDLQVRG